MALLVDEAIWAWRGRRWAHLVTDSHVDELHQLAHTLGLPYLAFQGDHYDVHEDLRVAAISAGAVPTPARDLVRALRAAGLRRRGPVPAWEWTVRRAAAAGPLADAVAGLVAAELVEPFIAAVDAAGALDELGAAQRSGARVLVASTSRRHPIEVGLERLSPTVSLHRSTGERGTYVELLVTDSS
ncbi:MAG: DUF4031 domain-containing protein [Acidimicrobiia bacterium]|nr:DUF4031 domain-containing protein [Acidimicrobiia bacterium]